MPQPVQAPASTRTVSSTLIAPRGHASAHAPQSTHRSGAATVTTGRARRGAAARDGDAPTAGDGGKGRAAGPDGVEVMPWSAPPTSGDDPCVVAGADRRVAVVVPSLAAPYR